MNSSIYPWVPYFNRRLNEKPIPDFSGEILYITSDYSGGHPGAKFDVLSFLVIDFSKSKQWQILRSLVRKQHLPDNRRMSFKRLSDRHRQNALQSFLIAANKLPGLLLTIGISKSIKNLCEGKEFLKHFSDNNMLTSKWNDESFENSFRIIHFVALLVSYYARTDQSILWVSDQDNLFANEIKSNDVKMLLESICAYYINHPIKEFSLGTTQIDPGDLLEEDLNAIPDFAAGAISELLNHVRFQSGKYIPSGIVQPINPGLSSKSDEILNWLSTEENSFLSRLNILFESRLDGSIALSSFKVG
ncbi:hypothetical protein [Leptospira wolffii]|uniref:hypothetical protein n=1 Tax=Leptospira wolffii TaxID=409998 RepID=UPI00030E9A9B|nr:hypothetical protein [Leptospira wolffii]EPG64656.1 hypothetical protein LEP1GSC061_1000 [Leptospira wolffii serovar Khorat str. Khorat-H2]